MRVCPRFGEPLGESGRSFGYLRVVDLRNDGRYFDGAGDHGELPGVPDIRTCTFEGWFVWLAGKAALLRDASGNWNLGYEDQGRLAYRAAGTSRVTRVPIEELRDGWHHYVLTKDGARVVYFLDGDPVDAWTGATDTAPLAPWTLMKDGPHASYVEGFAAHLAMYEHALPVDRVRAHWVAGSRECLHPGRLTALQRCARGGLRPDAHRPP
jgi:hypothetical protein